MDMRAYYNKRRRTPTLPAPSGVTASVTTGPLPPGATAATSATIATSAGPVPTSSTTLSYPMTYVTGASQSSSSVSTSSSTNTSNNTTTTGGVGSSTSGTDSININNVTLPAPYYIRRDPLLSYCNTLLYNAAPPSDSEELYKFQKSPSYEAVMKEKTNKGKMSAANDDGCWSPKKGLQSATKRSRLMRRQSNDSDTSITASRMRTGIPVISGLSLSMSRASSPAMAATYPDDPPVYAA